MEPVIEVRGLRLRFGTTWVHDGIDCTVGRREIYAIVGGSGSGKTTLMRQMLMLQQPTEGSVRVFGQEVTDAGERVLTAIRRRCGVLFQHGALFSGLTVLENVMFPMREHTDLADAEMAALARIRLGMVGLEPAAAWKYPAQLSGGMLKRAGLARALALDPELLFLDEPTSGLDPVSAAAFDELVLRLRDAMGLTIVFVTHDLDSLWRIADRVLFLARAKALAIGSAAEVADADEPEIREYFGGPRGRTARTAAAGRSAGEGEWRQG